VGTGDFVTGGTVLAQIRHQDLKNQLEQAQAQVSQAMAQHVQAEQDYDRARALYATQSLTRPDFDQAQAKFDSTLAAVEPDQCRFPSSAIGSRRFGSQRHLFPRTSSRETLN